MNAERGRRQIAILIFAAVLFSQLTAAPLMALTRRHDVEDSEYRALANESRYAATGKVLTGSSLGSGTLITPEWVLTARHVIGTSNTFTVGGTTYSALSGSSHKHPSEDIGLFQLTQPVTNVTPAELYTPEFGSELGRVGTLVGFGRSGTGLTGETGSAGTKRAGRNMIDKYGSDWGWSSNLVLVDFDSPDGQSSSMGSRTPLDLEYGCAHGDSGGGLYVEIDGNDYVAGVMSLLWYTDGTLNADYGDGGAFVRVSTMYDWIDGIVPFNEPPVAVDDAYGIDEDCLLDVLSAGVLLNDSDPDADPLSALKVTDPAHGSLSLEADGSFRYTPQPDYFGLDSFTYKANDGRDDSNAATVNLTVNPINDAPVALHDSYCVDEDNGLYVPEGVLANDYDVDGDELTVYPGTGPSHGTLVIDPEGWFVYTPNADFSGADGFVYIVSDGQEFSEIAAVAITVDPVNDPPVAVDDNFTTEQDTGLWVPEGVLANDYDVDGDELTIHVGQSTSHGELTLLGDDALVYVPEEGFFGIDWFNYILFDGEDYSTPATATIEVLQALIPGDANIDGAVTDADAAILAGNWQTPSGAEWADGDFNGDGNVNDADAAILATHWQEGVAEAAAPVPEPSTPIALLSITIAGLLTYTWRRRR